VLEELKGQPAIDLDALKAEAIVGGRPIEVGREAPPQESPPPRRKSRSEMTPAELMAEWEAVDARIRAGEDVGEDLARWHRMFQEHPIFKAERRRRDDGDFRMAAG